ncbi:MAG: hypothetical protein R3C97_12385 [Geminicoccaceae bacterium]
MKSLNTALNGISIAPCPYRRRAAPAATKPIAAKTRWPVSSISIITANMVIAINSWLMRRVLPAGRRNV